MAVDIDIELLARRSALDTLNWWAYGRACQRVLLQFKHTYHQAIPMCRDEDEALRVADAMAQQYVEAYLLAYRESHQAFFAECFLKEVARERDALNRKDNESGDDVEFEVLSDTAA